MPLRAPHRAATGFNSTIFAVALLLSGAAWADGSPRIPLGAEPSAVTVYNDQATVTRTGSVQVPEGDSVVVVSDLPSGVLVDSITVRGQADGEVLIGSVETRHTSIESAAANPRRVELEEAIRELEGKIGALDVHISGFEAQLAFLSRLSGGFRILPMDRPEAEAVLPWPGGPATPLGKLAEEPGAWEEAWTALREGTTEAGDGLRLAQAERRILEERLGALEDELATMGISRPGHVEVAIAVHSERPAMLDLDVSYQVRGASWRPVYQARLNTATGRLAILNEAVVTQATGEDWEGVTLSLSTSRPSGSVQPPSLSPWRIALEEPRQPDEGDEVAAVAPRVSAEAFRGRMFATQQMAAAPIEAKVIPAEAVVSGLSVEYSIPGTANVRSDGTERRVRIAEVDSDAALSVRAVPRFDPTGYLHAGFGNGSVLPMLPGTAALYVDGVYVGKSEMPLLRPDEETVLPFGPDDRVKIVYEPQENRRSAEGMLWSKKNVLSRDALITVRSFHDHPVAVTVLDQVPVSSDADLAVEMRADPQPTVRDVDDRPGVVEWTATYQPQEERRIRFGYTVTAPEGSEVTGLGR